MKVLNKTADKHTFSLGFFNIKKRFFKIAVLIQTNIGSQPNFSADYKNRKIVCVGGLFDRK